MILALDANGLVRTLYHMNDVDGPADAVERFLNRLHYLRAWGEGVAETRGESLTCLAVFDHPGKCFRYALLRDYKGQRPYDPGAYEAVDHAREALLTSDTWQALQSPVNYEADDAIASIAAQAAESVVIHSADKDFNQCLVPDRVGIVKKSGVEALDEQWQGLTRICGGVPVLVADTLTHSELVSKYGFPASRWVDYQCLVGDSADNVKGALGVGDKTARKAMALGKPLQDITPDEFGGNKRVAGGWDDFLSRLETLRHVFTLKTSLEVGAICH